MTSNGTKDTILSSVVKKESEADLNLEKSKRESKKIMDGMEDNVNGEMDPNMHDPDEAHGSSHFLAFNKVLPIQGFIFEKWNIKNTGDVAWTCVVIGLLAFLVEFIKFGKIKISRKFKTKKWLRAGTISLLHFLQVTCSYVLMLAVMTFHPGIFFAACVGLTIGFFVFRALCSSNLTTDEDCCE
ncbi:unnamed protein product [Oikopleura dioica]|uniref:Copper transport protein n=1 Tax=Oikopleura dioica TaxID=34765 RepID=E4YAZ3_OIKDI|nr:unnamed protein product [Oikopleura dioica]